MTFFAPNVLIFWPAIIMSFLELIVRPVSTSASGIFGVTTVASGIKFSLIVMTASSVRSVAPPFATMTGSTINGPKSYFFRFSTTIETCSESASIPVLHALIAKSSAIDVNCSLIILAGSGRLS